MRVAEFGCDVELEVGIIVNFLVPETNYQSVTFKEKAQVSVILGR